MAAVTLQSLAKKLERIEAMLALSDWTPEEDGLCGLSIETLRRMRRDPKHMDGWQYTGEGVDSKGRTIRRNIRWSKTYLNSVFVSPGKAA